jgi:hypothetical protein
MLRVGVAIIYYSLVCSRMVCGLLSIGCWGLKAHLIGWIHAIMLGPDYATMCLYDFSVLAISLYAMQIFMSFAIYPTFEHMIGWIHAIMLGPDFVGCVRNYGLIHFYCLYI